LNNHPRITELFVHRFWAKIDRSDPDGCWPWTRYRNEHGYGLIRRGDRIELTHRVVWELTYGAIPPDMCVCHSCDSPPCCRAEHLFLGTHQDNMADRALKGRSALCAGSHRTSNPNAAEATAAESSQPAWPAEVGR
jgi:hypothetical protein